LLAPAAALAYGVEREALVGAMHFAFVAKRLVAAAVCGADWVVDFLAAASVAWK
jgi:hypothetical protein